MKKILPVFLTLALLCALPTDAFALEPSEDFYVYDETGSLSSDTIQEVIDANVALENSVGAQIVIVFINYFGDTYADVYAVQLFNDWNVSGKGMLLAVSPTEGRGWLATGSEIDSRFTDAVAEKYLDKYFWDDFDDGKYDKAVTKLVSKICDWYEDEFDVTLSSGSSSSGHGTEAAVGIGTVILAFLLRNIFLIIILVVIVWLVLRDRRRYRMYYLGLGLPIPRYHFWYMFGGPHHRPGGFWGGGPRGPGGRGGPGGPGGPGGFGGGGRSGGSFGSPRGSGMGGHAGGGGAGRSGRSSGGFSGGHSGGSFHGGGGHAGGGGAGRR